MKINLTSSLLTEARRRAAVEALNGEMRKTCEVRVENGEVAVRKKDNWPRFSVTVPFVWR